MSDSSLSAQLRGTRSELMILQMEAIALRLFDERGFANVTVDELAAAAQTSVRTFYRYFPSKEDILQVRVDQRAETLRRALAGRSSDEPPLRSLRLALTATFAEEDADLVRQWISVIASSAQLVRGVLGGVQVKVQGVIADFLAVRLRTEPEALAPIVLAAAAGGVVQASMYRWFANGGDLADTIDEGLAAFEEFSSSTWIGE
jgi:AcrR family transcriptional regulator